MYFLIPPIQTKTHRSHVTHKLGGFLLMLLVLHNVQPFLCHHTIQNYNKRLPSVGSDEILPADKRTLMSGSGIGGSAGQPEEIFSASDQLDSNYDEYPMVVPKRAALLLDRLMVALHHALEKEHSGTARLSDFYNNKNLNKITQPPANNRHTDDDKDNSNLDNINKDSPYLTMYSDDDPNVMMDYDFKDLNSINRATGETLMAQSFQRRANMGLDLGGDIGIDGVSSLLASSPSLGHGSGLLNGFRNVDISGGGGGVSSGGGIGGSIVGVGEGRANLNELANTNNMYVKLRIANNAADINCYYNLPVIVTASYGAIHTYCSIMFCDLTKSMKPLYKGIIKPNRMNP